jgi:SpoVK/Ycf46/Vps4 family AAA+-type ATPase
VILLHGPPGSGKTSLCKALAQKLSIRFSHRCTVYFIVFPEIFSYIFLFCADVVCDSFPTKTTFLIVITHVRYAHTQLVEVDAHSLFSKWFSESGKLVRS